MVKQTHFWLSDEVWAALEPHLPHGQPGNRGSMIAGSFRAFFMF